MLGYILLIAALIAGAATGNDLRRIGGYFAEGLLAWSTLQLLGMVTLIEMLTLFLQATGSLQRILTALRRVFRDSRVLIAVVPSVMGLFPVPGGAMLSAPVVGSYGDEIGLDGDRKSAINLFFRHIWDLVFPFKPHLLVAAAVVNVPLFTLVGWQLPVTVATLLVGFWHLVGRRARVGPSVQPFREPDPAGGRPLWVEVAPLLIPLVLALGLGIDFLYAIGAGLLFGVVTQRVPGGLLKKMVMKGVRPRLLFVLASVMIFKTVLDYSGLVGVAASVLTGYGVSVGVLAVLLPLAVGLATGVEVAGVAIVFPMVAGLVPSGAQLLPYVLVMQIANAVGQTLSPVHVCMVVGNEYYGAKLARVVRMNLLPQAFRMAAGIAFAWAVGTYLAG